MRNPFRRQTEAAAPTLRERAAGLRASLTGATRKPEIAAAGQDPEGTAALEEFAVLDFAAYTFDGPVKTPTEWANQFVSPAMAMHVADRTLRMTKPELIAFIRDAGERNAAAPEIMFRNLDASQETLEGWGNLLGTARARYIVAASAACIEPSAIGAIEASDTPVSRPAPAAFDFGPDTHIAELAAEFCEAYAANIKADRALMAGQIAEQEWLPHYEAAKALMERLEATEPKTMLGMALKCLGPIGAAGYNAPADEDEVQTDAWDRAGTELAKAVHWGALAPLPLADQHRRPVDLIAAAGLMLGDMSLRDIAALHDATTTLSSVVRAMQMQPRSWHGPHLSDVGKFADWLGDQLDAQIDATVKELRACEPADWIERDIRLEAIAEATISNGDPAQTAAFARELLAKVGA